jgi:phosphoserine phosphatase
MKALKYYGFKTAILSGGFTWEVFTKRIGIDYVHANELEIIDGKLTGKYLGDIVDGPKKASTSHCRKKEAINQTIAVGDGANDLPMLNLAGLELLFMPKQR